LDIAGYGPYEGRVAELARGVANVVLHGRVTYTVGLALTANASAIVATYDPAIPNHKFCCPNKVYEGLALGIPVVVACGSGIDQLVLSYEAGVAVPFGDILALDRALSTLAGWDVTQLERFATRVQTRFASELSAASMKARIQSLYRDLFGATKPLICANAD
jgi:glycosyltransferase involved in cell wall biosynthesis